ncbi:MAG: hypothetical protein JSU94_06025 [Phycisphaerales bacterium]|nr:MAG: hypothetical protein JSU94_06025 [Phycisphaerales bacterium]
MCAIDRSIPRLVWVFLLTLTGTAVAGHVIYVDVDAVGANDGSSWINAYKYLQDALADANSSPKPIEIRVAEGIYTPDQGSGQAPGGRGATFQLISGVAVLGGYAGFGEPDPNARDIGLYETILSGDLNGDDAAVSDPCDLPTEPTRAENCYNVVTGSATDATAIINGFTVAAGWDNRSFCPIPELPEFCESRACGAGMHNRDGSPTVKNCTFRGNCACWGDGHPAMGWGGGMYNAGNSSPKITGCAFRDNWSYMGGGACNDSSACSSFEKCAFIGNGAFSGGAVQNIGSNATLAACTFHANTAGNGAGITNLEGSPTVSDCTFTENSATYRAGAIYNDYGSNAKITGCTFSGNSANSIGGAICNDSKTEPVIAACKFYENSAERGGGVHNCSSSATITGCVFEENSAAMYGGAVCNQTFSDPMSPTLLKCLLVDNSAGSGGGAVCNLASNKSLTVTITNSTFQGNLAAGGGGIYSQKSQPSNYLVVSVTNCILRGDTPDELWNEQEPVVEVTYSDIEGGWPGYNNIDVDPCFADPAGGDYHLKSQAGRWDPNSKAWVQDAVNSVCIDSGSPMSDLGNEPWPHGGSVNMGAYGATTEASMSLSDAGHIADLTNDDIINFPDFSRLAQGYEEKGPPSVADLDRNIKVGFEDIMLFADNWLVDNRVGLPFDDFNDNIQSSLWAVQADDPANCWLEEINGRLEARATANAAYARAAYVSDGWVLDVDTDFSFKVDFHYSRASEQDAWILVHVVPSETDDANDPHVEISAGHSAPGPYFWYEVAAKSGGDEHWTPRSADDGTFYISYNSTADELYVSYTGYGSENAFRTASGLLKGVWAASPVRIKLGGGSIGQVLDSGDAYLDNFTVETGTVK